MKLFFNNPDGFNVLVCYCYRGSLIVSELVAFKNTKYSTSTSLFYIHSHTFSIIDFKKVSIQSAVWLNQG